MNQHPDLLERPSTTNPTHPPLGGKSPLAPKNRRLLPPELLDIAEAEFRRQRLTGPMGNRGYCVSPGLNVLLRVKDDQATLRSLVELVGREEFVDVDVLTWHVQKTYLPNGIPSPSRSVPIVVHWTAHIDSEDVDILFPPEIQLFVADCAEILDPRTCSWDVVSGWDRIVLEMGPYETTGRRVYSLRKSGLETTKNGQIHGE